MVGISLDTKDTMGRIPNYITQNGITFPLLGESLGWDGEADDQLHVESIPHVVIIGSDGRIAEVGLTGETPADSMAKLSTAIDAVLGTNGADPLDGELIP